MQRELEGLLLYMLFHLQIWSTQLSQSSLVSFWCSRTVDTYSVAGLLNLGSMKKGRVHIKVRSPQGKKVM